MANESYDALMDLLRDALGGEEFDAACGLIDTLMSNPGAPTTDRKSAADSRYTGAIGMNLDIKPPTSRVVRGVQRYEAARREVAPYVGDVGYICDSADEVYKAALKRLGHDVREIKAEGVATAMWPALKNKKPAQSRAVAMDAKATERREQMFPHGARLVRGSC
jgi:hypothetical protein